MFNYAFTVPESKKVRVLVYTDCKNEADDQFALAHFLMTSKFDVVGIVAAHFERRPQEYGSGNTAKASAEEVHKVLSLMNLEGTVPVAEGSAYPLENETTPRESAGMQLLVEEALKDDPRPLYIACLGSLTDLASAILAHPEICPRATAIWVGGGVYPAGGDEFNLWQDIAAANVLFESTMPVWQLPKNVYKMLAVSLAELQLRVKPCGELGEYLFTQMADYNLRRADWPEWPHGETWGLGDQAALAVLMEEREKADYTWLPAPRFGEDMFYICDRPNRPIRAYRSIDARLTLEDMYAKLALNFGNGTK